MKGKPWTEEQDALLRERYPDPNRRAALPRLLARTPCAVRQRAHDLGLARPRARWTPAEDHLLTRALLPEGRTFGEAARRWRALELARTGQEPAPGARAGIWEAHEDILLMRLYRPPGRSWAQAAGRARTLGME